MPVAMKRVESIGWLLLVFLVAILLYPLSLNVATMRSDLDRTEASIMAAQRDIGYLEAEMRARASLARLEEWNALYYGYEAPQARQFLEGEAGLAALGGARAATVPVLVSVDIDGVAPAGTIGSTVPTRDDAEESRRLRAEAKLAVAEALPIPDSADRNPPGTEAPRARTERIARLEDKLVSPAMLARMEAESRGEAKRP